MEKRIKKDYPTVTKINDNQRIEIVKDIFSLITSKYDILNRSLSLGQDLIWRNKGVKHIRFFKSYKLLDIATGTGNLNKRTTASGLLIM